MKTMKITKDKDGTVHIEWPNRVISDESWKYLSRHILAEGSYAPSNTAERQKLQNIVSRLGEVSLQQAISARAILIKARVISTFSRMKATIERLASLYTDAKNGIVSIATKYGYAPLNMMRAILLHLGKYSKSQINAVFSGRVPASACFDERDAEEFIDACKNDAEATFDQQRIAEVAAHNESLVVDAIRKMGIAVTTQAELAEKQVAEHGRAVLTPDLLFTTPVYINGSRVNWIDYKDYLGTPVSWVRTSNIKQAKRYLDALGPGALCYRHGFVAKLTESLPEGVIALDAAALDVEFREFVERE